MDTISAKELIEGANIISLQRGGAKRSLLRKRQLINFAFATVVTIANIKAGDKFTKKIYGLRDLEQVKYLPKITIV